MSVIVSILPIPSSPTLWRIDYENMTAPYKQSLHKTILERKYPAVWKVFPVDCINVTTSKIKYTQGKSKILYQSMGLRITSKKYTWLTFIAAPNEAKANHTWLHMSVRWPVRNRFNGRHFWSVGNYRPDCLFFLLYLECKKLRQNQTPTKIYTGEK